MATLSNYEMQIIRARKLFLHFDQSAILRRLPLEHDLDYIKIRFINRKWNICRNSGMITDVLNGDEANFNTYLSIFDYICRDNTTPHMLGRKQALNSLGKNIHPGVGDSLLFNQYASKFSAEPDKLGNICSSLGARPFPVGDVAFEINIFDELSVAMQLWLGDDEFAPRLSLLWDESTLEFLFYETCWYIASELLSIISTKLDVISA